MKTLETTFAKVSIGAYIVFYNHVEGWIYRKVDSNKIEVVETPKYIYDLIGTVTVYPHGWMPVGVCDYAPECEENEDDRDYNPGWDDGECPEDDGQPTEYEEWQDYMGGDDWDHGQFEDCDY